MMYFDPSTEMDYRRERLMRSYRAGASHGLTVGAAGRSRRHHHLPRLRVRHQH